MNLKKKTVAFGLTLAVCAGMGVGALAASNSETITALLNRDLKITYNGVEQHFTDATGSAVYPISYKDTTYLPVRAISGLVGLPIDYNAATDTVELGTKTVQPSALVDLNHSANSEYSQIIVEPAELTVATTDGDKTYTNGINWNIWNSIASSGADRAMMFDINGYSSITFTAWSDVDCTVVVYDQDGELASQFELAAKTPIVKTLPLAATQTQIGFAADSEVAWVDGTLKIFDASVK